VNVTLKSLADEELQGSLTLVSEERSQRSVILDPHEIRVESFNLSFKDHGLKDLKVVLDVKKDFDVKVFQVNVYPAKEVSFFDTILEFLKKIVESIVSFLKGISF
jgi:hypothetical protein